MEYKKYQHIEKLGSSEVEAILNGVVNVFYKIDGTNGCIWNEDGEIKFGSRNRELKGDRDNADFKKLVSLDTEVLDELKDYLEKFPDRIIYGEWLVPHTLKTYKEDAWKHFYVFDVYIPETEEGLGNDRYIPYSEYSTYFDEHYKHIKYIPLLKSFTNPTVEELKECLQHTGEWLISNGLGEGIVIKNYDYHNRYGRKTWAKMLTEDYLSKKKDTRQSNKENKQSDDKLEFEISKMMTTEHILKEKAKIEEARGGWSDKYIFELLERSFKEFWRDNWEIILKKYRYPRINFRVLKQLCDMQVKQVLNI